MKPLFLLFLFMNLILNNLFGQNHKTQWSDTLYSSRKLIAGQNSEGFAKAIGLNNEQQQKLENLDIEFLERMQNVRNSNAYGREKSIAMKSVYGWREKELALLLNPQQLSAYKTRNQLVQQKIATKSKRPASGTSKPVLLKRK